MDKLDKKYIEEKTREAIEELGNTEGNNNPVQTVQNIRAEQLIVQHIHRGDGVQNAEANDEIIALRQKVAVLTESNRLLKKGNKLLKDKIVILEDEINILKNGLQNQKRNSK